MIRILKRLFAGVAQSVQAGPSVRPWDHGWETDRVRSTRYTGTIGFTIGFSLPKNPYDCDRAEMMDWLRSKGVSVFQCGGYPGAEVLAVVDGVRNVEQANEWLPKFLPVFDEWVRKSIG